LSLGYNNNDNNAIDGGGGEKGVNRQQPSTKLFIAKKDAEATADS
jgi:hypothetical protein